MSKNHAARFPSLVVRAQELEPIGEFALTQATYLRPNVEDVAHLDALLRKHQIGVVAHFYMDPELQGVLAGCSHPHIHVSDSLVMADRAVGMAKAGARAVVVLGVDFMSEGVRAMLDAAGFAHVPVYRLATEAIGCSLAEAADSKEYGAFLALASRRPRSLHVTYINTSLRLKAKADALVPTITCTSSNVVRTVLTAFAQMPEAHVWFGPDTYMGRNIQMLFESLLFMPEEEIRRLHPSHTQQTVHDFLPRFHVFDRGNCVVHNLFGGSVVEKVRTHYQEAFVAAHLEVPGEMFQLAMERAQTGRGVVGSTSQILEFIRCTVRRNLDCPQDDRLTFVLGTEAGMITSIVRETQKLLQGATERLEVEIVFPVANDAVAPANDRELPVVPGSAGGEGCSAEAGCATCPYMKMNSLSALRLLIEEKIAQKSSDLPLFFPQTYTERYGGLGVVEAGGIPILEMRYFQKEGLLSSSFVERITGAA